MGYTDEIVRKKIEAIAAKRQKATIKKRVKTSNQKRKVDQQVKSIESVVFNDKLSAKKKLEIILNQL